jgi:hypothetical protein
MRDLVAAAQTARARKAKANGHARDPQQETRIKALRMANDLLSEIQARWPHESTQDHVVRLHRAVSHSTDADLFQMFFPDDDRDCIEVAVS